MQGRSEKEIRKKIDQELQNLGWKKLPSSDTSSTGYKEEVRESKGRPIDYVLYINGKASAIVEAKREDKDPKPHLQQARNYANALESQRRYGSEMYAVPFVFSSNGNTTYIGDLRNNTADDREVSGFYTPEDIERKLKNSTTEGIDYLKSHTYEDIDEKLWKNQQKGLEAIKEEIYEQHNRMLVSMATGSGKTRLAMALVYQLLESGYVDKILFIPDTKQLERDAKAAFENYSPPGQDNFSDKYVVQDLDEYERHKDGNVVVTTIQKLSNRLENHSVGEFDVKVVDEYHRGVYNDEGYGEALDFFDALEIGLTATPHEKTLERCNQNKVYEYSYQDALDDELVVPFEPHEIKTKITMEGIHHNGKHYTPKQLGRDVIVQSTNRKIASQLAQHINFEDELTLVFAQNVSHANQIAEDFKQELDLENPHEQIKVITSENRHSEDILENFKRPRRNPRIAITVRMVSTGVDIRPLNNLVFMRAIKSKILYNQMMGRGTRTYSGKKRFKVFDCVGLLEYYDSQPPFNTEKVQYKEGSSSGTGTGGTTKDPEVVSERGVDEIIKDERLYPIPSDFVKESVYLDYVRNAIYENKEEIVSSVEDCTSISDANEQIESILKDEFEYYQNEYILSANTNNSVENLFEFVRELLLMEASVEKNANQAKSTLQKKYNLTETQEEWITEMEKRATLENTSISKERLLDPPFSKLGGYDEAKNVFEEPTIQEVLDTFNNCIVSLKPP